MWTYVWMCIRVAGRRASGLAGAVAFLVLCTGCPGEGGMDGGMVPSSPDAEASVPPDAPLDAPPDAPAPPTPPPTECPAHLVFEIDGPNSQIRLGTNRNIADNIRLAEGSAFTLAWDERSGPGADSGSDECRYTGPVANPDGFPRMGVCFGNRSQSCVDDESCGVGGRCDRYLAGPGTVALVPGVLDGCFAWRLSGGDDNAVEARLDLGEGALFFDRFRVAPDRTLSGRCDTCQPGEGGEFYCRKSCARDTLQGQACRAEDSFRDGLERTSLTCLGDDSESMSEFDLGAAEGADIALSTMGAEWTRTSVDAPPFCAETDPTISDLETRLGAAGRFEWVSSERAWRVRAAGLSCQSARGSLIDSAGLPGPLAVDLSWRVRPYDGELRVGAPSDLGATMCVEERCPVGTPLSCLMTGSCSNLGPATIASFREIVAPGGLELPGTCASLGSCECPTRTRVLPGRARRECGRFLFCNDLDESISLDLEVPSRRVPMGARCVDESGASSRCIYVANPSLTVHRGDVGRAPSAGSMTSVCGDLVVEDPTQCVMSDGRPGALQMKYPRIENVAVDPSELITVLVTGERMGNYLELDIARVGE